MIKQKTQNAFLFLHLVLISILCELFSFHIQISLPLKLILQYTFDLIYLSGLFSISNIYTGFLNEA